MGNKKKSEKIFRLQEQLSKFMPRGDNSDGWSCSLRDPLSTFEAKTVDAKLTIRSPQRQVGVFGVVLKTLIWPQMVATIQSQLKDSIFDGYLVAADFLSPRTRELLSNANLNYIDLTGNTRIVMNQPAVFIETQGKDKNPQREFKSMKSLRGPAAARAVRALCDFRPPYNTSDLARKAGASVSTLSRALTLLETEALITTSAEKRDRIVTQVACGDLIRQWTQDYSVLKANGVSTLIAPRGLSSLRPGLAETTVEYAVTGSLAARIPTAVAPGRLAMIYAADPTRLADDLGLRPAEAGANVLLLEPFDSIVFERATTRDGLLCAALSQVAADLLTSPGRGPEEGEELLRWMKENEDEWRD